VCSQALVMGNGDLVQSLERPGNHEYGRNIIMIRDKKPVTLKDLIDPEHLLQAIKNSLNHSGETAHGVTGLVFKRYTITVRKKAGLSWSVECRFRGEDTDFSLQTRKRLRSRCRTRRKRP